MQSSPLARKPSFRRRISLAQPLLALLLAADAGAVCGDSILVAGEQCDDGNFERDDGCSARCESEVEVAAAAADCIERANGAAAKLARSQGKQTASCLKGAAAATVPDAAACLEGDPRGKVAAASAVLDALEAGLCAVPPPFGWAPAATVSGRVFAEDRALVGDLFGPDPTSALVTKDADADGARCQGAASSSAQRLLETAFGSFLRCKKSALDDGGIVSSSDLSTCVSVLGTDPSGKVEKASDRVSSKIASSCAGLDAASLFPGSCAASASTTALAACVKSAARCRACLAIRATDALIRPACDAVDDGSLNGSCEGGQAPAPSLADAARAAGLAIGSTVDADTSAPRRALVAAEFSSVTIENSLKWAPLSPSPGIWDFTAADAQVAWAETGGLRVRGHTLFWDRLNGRPSWLAADVTGSSDPAAQLTMRMEEHAAEVVGRYAGRLAQWDVVNEPLEQAGTNLDATNFFYQVLGEDYLDIAFHAAHAADPTAELFLNEVLSEGINAKFNALVSLVEGMIARGVPVHGVGLQGHFFFGTLPYDALVSRLERLTALGVKVEFTEVDVPLPLFDTQPYPLAAQAEAWADIVAACAAVPGCTGVTAWGSDDGDTWLDTFSLTAAAGPNRPLLFDAALAPKPAYDSVKRMLEWSSAP